MKTSVYKNKKISECENSAPFLLKSEKSEIESDLFMYIQFIMILIR